LVCENGFAGTRRPLDDVSGAFQKAAICQYIQTFDACRDFLDHKYLSEFDATFLSP
jgi:hypothetical protein